MSRFITFTSRNIGTTPVAIGAGATPATGKVWTVIGLSLCNVSVGSVSVTAHLLDAAAAVTRMAYAFPLPSGESVSPAGAQGKLVMQPTETILVTSTIAASVDAMLTVLETP